PWPASLRRQFLKSHMTPSEFVNKLAEVAPSLSELERLGLSRSEAVSIRNGYICTRRDTPLSIPESNELTALMKYWDTSTVEVGMVRMLEMPVETERGLQIGLVEDDPLVAASASGELFVEERGTRGHLLWRVARS